MSKKIKLIIVFAIVILAIIAIPKNVEATAYRNMYNYIQIKINGTDTNYKSNTLTEGNISVYVGENLVSPSIKSLSSATDITGGVQYTLTLRGVTGDGALTLKIAANTLEDQATNKNIINTINTGITMDNTPPAFSTSDFKYDTVPYGGLPITIRATATDATSGIDYICANSTNSTFTGENSASVSRTVNDSYTWNTFYAVDKAGNVSKTYTYVLQINYKINPNHTSKVMDVSGAGFTNLTNLQIYDSNSTDSQKFRLQKDSSGYLTILNKISSKAVDLAGNTTTNGTNIDIYDSNGESSQKWLWTQYSTSSYGWLRSKTNTAKAIDVNGAGTANYTNIQIWDKGDVSQQKWQMTASLNSSRVYTSDTTAPVVKLVSNSSGGNWTNQDVTMKISGVDSESGIDHYEWNENGSSWRTYAMVMATDGSYANITFSAERNSTVKFRAVDKAGNYSNEVSATLKIDKTAPYCTVAHTPNSMFGKLWDLIVTFYDKDSGYSRAEFEWQTGGSGDFQKWTGTDSAVRIGTDEKVVTWYLKIYDKAGNYYYSGQRNDYY